MAEDRMSSATYVIVEAGQAAAQAVASLRQEGFAGRIIVLGDEPFAPYQRPPLSKKFLLGELECHRLLLKPGKFYSRFSIDLRLSTQVDRIDCDRRCVHTRNGDLIAYDKLLLASGSRPRRLEVPGLECDCFYYLRTIADVEKLRPLLRPGATMVVIGSGYIGLEVAAVAVSLGMQVEVIEVASRLLPRVAGPAISEFFLNAHTARGVTIHLETGVVALEDDHSGRVRLELSNDKSLFADIVVVGIGVVPNSELGEAAGLATADGIIVDDYARTNAPDVFAAGDCTRHPNPFYATQLRLESVANAIEQAKTAAAVMCGKAKPYHQVPWFWSDQFALKYQAAGLIANADRHLVKGDPTASCFSVTYYCADRPIAIEAINAPADFMATRAEIARGFHDLQSADEPLTTST